MEEGDREFLLSALPSSSELVLQFLSTLKPKAQQCFLTDLRKLAGDPQALRKPAEGAIDDAFNQMENALRHYVDDIVREESREKLND